MTAHGSLLRPRVEAARLAPSSLASLSPVVLLVLFGALLRLSPWPSQYFLLRTLCSLFSWVLMLRVLQLMILVCPRRLAPNPFLFLSASVMSHEWRRRVVSLVTSPVCLHDSDISDGFSGRRLRRHVEDGPGI